jgi:hypothetical protein
MKAQIKCPRCNRLVLEYDIEELAAEDASGKIKAKLFKTLIPGEVNPKPGDSMQCAYCRSNLMEEVRKTWRKVKRELKNEEWDR